MQETDADFSRVKLFPSCIGTFVTPAVALSGNLMGHSNLETTMIYTCRLPSRLAEDFPDLAVVPPILPVHPRTSMDRPSFINHHLRGESEFSYLAAPHLAICNSVSGWGCGILRLFAGICAIKERLESRWPPTRNSSSSRKINL